MADTALVIWKASLPFWLASRASSVLSSRICDICIICSVSAVLQIVALLQAFASAGVLSSRALCVPQLQLKH